MIVEIELPILHSGQVKIYNDRAQFNAYKCGRRFGKTIDMVVKAADRAIKGQKIGLFTPEFKQLSEPFDMLSTVLHPLINSRSRKDGHLKLKTGAKIDFWTLNDNFLAGRGREYHYIGIDEAAFSKNVQMLEIWEKAITPTLLTTNGCVDIYSTPNGINPDNFFYQICHDQKMGFKVHHAPSSASPYVNLQWLERKRQDSHPLVFRQEYLAEFVDWSGVAFFDIQKLLIENQAVALPQQCEYVFATVDSALKDGSGNDGTAVIYWAVSIYFGQPLVILDWDIVQINSDMLVNWLPQVFTNLENYAIATKARKGSAGAFIEDKGSGITLNQHCQRTGLPAEPICGKITSVGKDGRAINASGAVYRGDVKITQQAYDKVLTYKGKTANHLLTQVGDFRIGDKDAARRADDLLDTFTYGIIISLGGNEGF